MNKVMYCKKCGKTCYKLFGKKCKNCGCQMELLLESMKYKYHIFVEDWGKITSEEIINRKDNFVMQELANNPEFSISAYNRQVENQRKIDKRLADYHHQQNDERQDKLNKQTQKMLDKQNCIPKCPICGSTNINKITLTKRTVKTATFGVIGAIDDAGKTYQCLNCHSKF